MVLHVGENADAYLDLYIYVDVKEEKNNWDGYTPTSSQWLSGGGAWDEGEQGQTATYHSMWFYFIYIFSKRMALHVIYAI